MQEELGRAPTQEEVAKTRMEMWKDTLHHHHDLIKEAVKPKPVVSYKPGLKKPNGGAPHSR